MLFFQSFVGSAVLLAAVGSTIWIQFDFRVLKRQLDGAEVGKRSAAAWLIFCILLWIVAFPAYLLNRRRLLKKRAGGNVSTGQPANEPLYCDMCGTPYRTDARFCPGCGTALAGAPELAEERCAVCGSETSADAVYCSHCGAPAKAASQSARQEWRGQTAEIAAKVRGGLTREHPAASAAWFQRWFAVAGFVVVGLLVAQWLTNSALLGPHINQSTLEATIHSGLATQLQISATVSCPSHEPLRTGHVFFCHASVNGSDHVVRVTEQNANGDVIWQLIP